MTGPSGARAAPPQHLVHAAADVPRVRDLLREHLAHSLKPLLDQHTSTLYLPCHPGRRDLRGRPVMWSTSEYVAAVQRWLRSADLFYVNPDMTTVVRQAADAMPTYQVWEDQLPAPVGFVLFGGSYCSVTDDLPDARPPLAPGERCELTGALWATVDETDGGPGVLLITFQDSEVMIGTRPFLAGMPRDIQQRVVGRPVCYHEEYPLPFGDRLYGEDSARPVKNTAVGALMSTWIMMTQRITVETRERSPRALRRQYARDDRPEPTVRTITLRRAASKQPRQERQPGQESSRTYTKRWVVGEYGYWRNTWYPKAETHRLQYVYVPPFMKGPEKGELVGGERLNVLRR